LPGDAAQFATRVPEEFAGREDNALNSM
jgi:hypothetical protein